jgi:uncharacterized protein (TIGR00255 family)
MIKSMTGFATAEKTVGGVTVTADIRSYNNRYLDVVLRLPPNYSALEDKIRALIMDSIVRGRIEVKVQIKDTSEAALAFEIDMPKAKAIHAVLDRLRDEFHLKTDISLDLMLNTGGIIKPVESLNTLVTIWPVIAGCLAEAIGDLEIMRKKEGDFIAGDISVRLEMIEGCIRQFEKDSHNLLSYYQQRLKERIAALARETIEIDPGRLAQEAAFLADRSDISEEILRAASHLQQFRRIMRSDEPGGRKLNFLLQELHREFNTIGSKLGDADGAYRVVEVKSELEKIREQIQNVE